MRLAALLLARWAVTSRRRFQETMRSGCRNGSRTATSPYAGWLPSSPVAALKVDYQSVWDFVHAEKFSFKKKRGGWRTRSSGRGTAAIPVDKVPSRLEAERLVFIDETWTRTDMAPLRGWAPRGHRL